MSFKENKYEVVRNALSPEVVDFVRLNMNIHEYAGYTSRPPTEELKYTFGDLDVPNSFAFYSPLYAESLLVYLRGLFEKVSDKKLVETYSYMRIYYEGAELTKHVDRPSCQISATLCINKDADWPIFMQKENGEEVGIELNAGDLVLYSGCILPHWRLPYKGKRHSQIFLHYIDAQGQFSPKHKWDQRPSLWHPKTKPD